MTDVAPLDQSRRRWRWSRPIDGLQAPNGVATVTTLRPPTNPPPPKPPRQAPPASRRPRQSERHLPTERQWADTCQAAMRAVEHLESWGPSLLVLARAAGRGYPSSTRLEGGGGGTSTDRCTCGHRSWEHRGPCAVEVCRCGAYEPPVALTPTEAAADARPDVDERLRTTLLDVEVILTLLGRLHARVASLRPGGVVPTSGGTGGEGDCFCGRHCTGVGDDRLKSGYCPADWTAWLRAERPDRGEFEARRRSADGEQAA